LSSRRRGFKLSLCEFLFKISRQILLKSHLQVEISVMKDDVANDQDSANKTHLVYVKDAGLLGRGVFACENIPKKTFLGIYRGEVIGSRESQKRVAKNKGHYIFEFDDKTFIDGRVGGDWTSMMNHSRNFNVEAISDFTTKSIKLFSTKGVEKGEQLFLNYGKSWFKDNNIKEL
jgi:uncharacterized protein